MLSKFMAALLIGTTVPVLSAQNSNLAMVIHGGAGTITRGQMSPEREKQYRDKMEEALRAGHGILAKGGSSIDAVEATIRIMEDSPLFNAGKGAVFTREGRIELDASIMDGRTRAAGAVAGVAIIRNPISAARAVMERSDSVLLTGRGAEFFATRMGLETVDPSYFWTERRWNELQKKLIELESEGKKPTTRSDRRSRNVEELSTVGAVAVDRNGNIAAGTSTGGRTGKLPGRVGDSPIIGAGTWADNATCGVSATGHGEFFIRWAVASDIGALMQYRGMSLQDAAEEVINRKLTAVKGEGGVVALDAKGNIAMPFNTEGMYRGYIRADGVPHVFIYRD